MKNPNKFRVRSYLLFAAVMCLLFVSVATAAEPDDEEYVDEDINPHVLEEEEEEEEERFDDGEDSEALQAAEAHYQMAVQLYGQGRYRESVQEFDRVLELHEEPMVHCNRAIPLIELGRLRDARSSLIRCRDGMPEDSRDYQELSTEIVAIGTTLEVVRRARVVAGYVGSPPVVKESSTEETVQLAPPQLVEGPETRSENRGSALQRAGLILLGSGVGLGAAAAALDWQSADLVDEYRLESAGGEGTSGQRHQELRDQLEMRQRIFWTLSISGVAAATVGVGLWSLGALKTPADTSRGVYLDVTGDGIRAGWRARF